MWFWISHVGEIELVARALTCFTWRCWCLLFAASLSRFNQGERSSTRDYSDRFGLYGRMAMEFLVLKIFIRKIIAKLVCLVSNSDRRNDSFLFISMVLLRP
jgi:hypothetical protein